MSAEAHLAALKAKHKAYGAQLEEALSHASASDQEIADIKHRKLQLKDEIAALEASLQPVS